MEPFSEVKSVKQATEYSCGPACLESLLAHYGVDLSQERLTVLCKTSEAEGTSPENMGKALLALGFAVTEKIGGTWDELRSITQRGIPILVGWFSDLEEPGDEHYSIAYRLTDTEIAMMDPEIGGTRTLEKQDFLRRWSITEPYGWFITIEPIEKR
jgi:ABC-type bacteriocin/lantibiotic exporter with double-glycine peptidase domain